MAKYILIYSDNELLDRNNTVETFDTYDAAFVAMLEQVKTAAAIEDLILPDELEIGDLYANTNTDAFERCVGYIGDEQAYLSATDEKWVILEVPDFPSPKRNPNVAETVSYECAGDPRFSSGGVLLHKATVSWNSGKSFDVHAPERVELRIGGTSYEYKAI